MIVVVAEKPSVGRDIARLLKCSQRGDGLIKGEQYTVTWAVGHLVTLKEPQEVDQRYRKWRAEDLPILPEMIPTKVIPKTKSQFNVIKKLMLRSDTERLICATDAGREGELIFRLIYEQCGCKKPVDRLWISSMTDAAIQEGFSALKPSSAYDGLYRSALCRAKADWLVGMNASRAFTLRYQALLSVGRVQTPTLAILVKRAREIKAFVPEDYYTVTADFGDYQGQWFDEKATDDRLSIRIPTEEQAKEIAEQVRRKTARVKSADRETKRELPPQLYDLTSLQRDANRLLDFTASKTLKIAQSLYEKHKAITYPRTDSRYLPMDMLPRVPKTLDNLPAQYRDLVEGIPKQDGKLPVSKRIFDDSRVSDHHALIPTVQKANVDRMERDEAALFDLIARRLIAAFYPPYVYEAARVVTVCEGHAFKSTGRDVTQMGWKRVYPQQKEADQPLKVLPGDERKVKGARVKKEATKPPAPHTDASLLSAMEHAGREIEDEDLRDQMKGSGLGTPATRAAIIDRIIKVGYVSRKGKALIPTEKGERLIDVVPEEIASPEMTGKWEKALSEIAENKRDTERFMTGIRRLTEFLVAFTKEKAPDVRFEQEERKGKGRKAPSKLSGGVVCPVCHSPVLETEKAFGCSDWRNGCKFTLWKDALVRAGGPSLNRRIVTELLQKGEVKGSTGTIKLANGKLSYCEGAEGIIKVSVPILYEKKKG